jgi:hypothetical protein
MTSSQSSTNLDNLPIVVLRELISYLDVGHIIPLALVNRQLYDTLKDDNGLWLFLLRSRLNITLPRAKEDNAYRELLKHAQTERCNDCMCMEFDRRPYFHAFWNRPLCDACRYDEKYSIITARRARKDYFLNNDDLLLLKTISEQNKRYRNRPHTRYFSRRSVQIKSNEKLRATHTTAEERLAKQKQRSVRARQRHANFVQARRRKITEVLRMNGFRHADRHNCSAVDGYVRNRYRLWRMRTRWTMDDVLQQCVPAHKDVNALE